MKTAALRWLLVLLVAALATAAATATPRVLRGMASFHVQQVEVTGARYLSPQEAVAATGITPTSSVFDDFTLWRSALLRHPLVLDVTVYRRLPFTVVLAVTETTPVAFARLPELQPVDARGRLLDLDPTRIPLDLPLLTLPAARRAGSSLADPAALRALRALGRVAELEPALFRIASEVTPLPEGVQMVLREPAGARLLLPDQPDPKALRLLRLPLADVQAGPPDTARTGGPPRLRRIDARYREQIVVALTPNQSR